MPVVSINELANTARYLKEQRGEEESAAIQQAITAAGLSEEFAAEHDLESAIRDAMNVDYEQQREEAEQQLDQQRAAYEHNIFKDDQINAEVQEGEPVSEEDAQE